MHRSEARTQTERFRDLSVMWVVATRTVPKGAVGVHQGLSTRELALHAHRLADLYIRVSAEREGMTALERQEMDCREWAIQNGLIVRNVHADRGKSAFRSVERPGLESAIAAVASGVVGTLIVWKLDRLSRQGIGQMGLVLDQLEVSGARLVSVQDNVDTSDPQARKLVETLSELARSESANLGLRVRSAKSFLRRQGRWVGGKPPYGLVNREGRLFVDPETGPIVREIGRRVLEGATLTGVT